MCACEPGFVCSRCAGTPADPGYVDDEPELDPYFCGSNYCDDPACSQEHAERL